MYVHACIAKRFLAAQQFARNMNELTQVRSRTPAGIAQRALATHRLASNMNELTQE